ncbi:PRC-barrel domain-containing protein [Bradyrhizobium jicamae]|nr:PRC-barrel domain-containing protein [Bradyrhizobium jicamae]
MIAFNRLGASLDSDTRTASPPSPGRALTAYRTAPDWMIWFALAAFAAITTTTTPALPQAGVSLIKVDFSVVANGYRMSKLLGSNVINDKNEKIGTLDDVIADKKQVNFAVLQVGGFLGVGARLIVVPYESLVIDDKGQKITLPGASKEELKKLTEYHHKSS